MIDDKKFCEKQIARFSGLAGWPEGREARNELVCALQSFETQGQAERFVSDWLSMQSFCPKPAEIRIAARAENERNNTAWLDAKKCQNCSGSGFRMVRRPHTVPGCGTNTYDFAERCNHAA